MIHNDNWILQKPILTQKITKNSLVKIGTNIEKFNVEVIYIKSNNHIVGRINNNLVHETKYNIGDLVIFQHKHAIQITTINERHAKVDNIIPELKDMFGIYMKDYMEKYGRYPTKIETELYFERNFNTLLDTY